MSNPLTTDEAKFLILVCENLRIYTTDDHYAEMTEDMTRFGEPHFNDKLDDIMIKLRGMT